MCATVERWSAGDTKRLIEYLAANGDEKYREFNEKLVPGAHDTFGVRTPVLRAVQREIIKGDWRGFTGCDNGGIYELIALKGAVIASAKCGIEEKLERIEGFLPSIDNWAICDTTCCQFKDAAKNRERVYCFLERYFDSEREFDRRFALVMLLAHFITEEYISRVLSVYADCRDERYYVMMAAAWGISVCFVKFRDDTLEFLKSDTLPAVTHNKAIQKCCESLRVSDEDKRLLRGLKRKA